ncbi:hypothetical protein HZB60_00365 [candidate division KSB1 bacterium]|nr:hypothetical protein [candidate division KSB1 bacterium]
MPFLQLIVEALLYYLACSFVAKRREEAPGLIRIFLVVLLMAFVSGGVKYVIGDFWLTSGILFMFNLFVLWVGLGIGFFRTILAAVLVFVLRSILERAFAVPPGPAMFS